MPILFLIDNKSQYVHVCEQCIVSTYIYFAKISEEHVHFILATLYAIYTIAYLMVVNLIEQKESPLQLSNKLCTKCNGTYYPLKYSLAVKNR